jgi:hypothetical protein
MRFHRRPRRPSPRTGSTTSLRFAGHAEELPTSFASATPSTSLSVSPCSTCSFAEYREQAKANVAVCLETLGQQHQ